MCRDKTFSSIIILSFALAFALLFFGTNLAAQVKVVDAQYKLVRITQDTALPGCNGAQIGADGNLYVGHTGNNTISRIDLKTMKATTFVQPYAGVYIPDDLTADDKGNLYVTGTTPVVGEVYRVDKKGVKTVIASGLLAPNGIQYNFRTGRLFTSECFQANRVFEIDPMGVKPPKLLVKENTIPVPEGFDYDPDTNDLIIPDMATGRILRVHPDTGAISVIAEKFTAPMALKVGPDKKAYFVELFGPVYRISLDGKSREKLATLPTGLDNLAITKSGRLFVTSYWDSTIFEVSTDSSGKYKTLFPMGINVLCGIVIKGDKVLISDAIMIRSVEKGKYVQTKLNAWARSNMPLPIGLADGPGDQVFWPDYVHGAIAIGNSKTGDFQAIAGGLNRPMAILMSKSGAELYVAEYGAGQITSVNLKDGSKKIVTTGLEGPLALALIGDNLYVAEMKAGRISKVDPMTGKKEVFIVGLAGKPAAVSNDGSGNLLILDGASKMLFKVKINDMSISVVAKDLPVYFFSNGSYPPVESPYPMYVSKAGDIYMGTSERGVIMLKKGK